jgi:hypothetical protein
MSMWMEKVETSTAKAEQHQQLQKISQWSMWFPNLSSFDSLLRSSSIANHELESGQVFGIESSQIARQERRSESGENVDGHEPVLRLHACMPSVFIFFSRSLSVFTHLCVLFSCLDICFYVFIFFSVYLVFYPFYVFIWVLFFSILVFSIGRKTSNQSSQCAVRLSLSPCTTFPRALLLLVKQARNLTRMPTAANARADPRSRKRLCCRREKRNRTKARFLIRL